MTDFRPGMEDLRWVGQPKEPWWAYQTALADDGTIFMAAAINDLPEELTVFRAAANTAPVRLVYSDGHVYLPTTWMAENYPNCVDIAHMIETSVRQHFKYRNRQ